MTPVRRVRGFAAVAVVLAAVLLLSGCKVAAQVDVTLHTDGSGTVAARIVLDADAVRRLTTAAPLARAVPLDDVRAAGWTVSEWTSESGGGKALTLSHNFVEQADLAKRLADLVGPKGVLRNPHINRTRGWFGGKDTISVMLDMRDVSAAVRSDAQLAASLRGAGLDLNKLDAQLTSDLNQSLRISLIVRAPGGHANIVRLTAGNRATVGASSSRTYTNRIVWLAIGAGILVLELGFTAGTLLTRSRRRRTS